METDEEILQLAKRILTLSHPPQNADQAHWRLVKIQDTVKALIPRLQQQLEES